MEDRPDVRPEGAVSASTTAQDENARAEELTHASEAAAEHTARDPESALVAELEKLKADHAALTDKYLRLQAEFDNARKRNARERLELIQFAGENVLKNVLPVADDMDRAIANNDRTDGRGPQRQGDRRGGKRLDPARQSGALRQSGGGRMINARERLRGR